MLLHPAFAESLPWSNVRVMVEFGTIVYVPVTSVAVNVRPSRAAAPLAADDPAGTEPDEPEPVAGEPVSDESGVDLEAAPEEEEAAPDELLLAQADKASSAATASPAPNTVLTRGSEVRRAEVGVVAGRSVVLMVTSFCRRSGRYPPRQRWVRKPLRPGRHTLCNALKKDVSPQQDGCTLKAINRHIHAELPSARRHHPHLHGPPARSTSGQPTRNERQTAPN
jgi:hypothetical protein